MEHEFIEENQVARSKTSRRMRYEAEAVMIQRQLGSLDEIQERLGISGHKLCKMLLIDPSAWSRWKKQGQAPPYVFRALQWFTLLEEKYPGLGPQTFLVDTGGVQAKADLQAEIDKRRALEVRLAEELGQAKKEQKSHFDELTQSQRQLKKQNQFLVASLAILAAVIFSQWFFLV